MSRCRLIFCAVIAALLTSVVARAQVMQTERRVVARMFELRGMLLDACLRADPEVRRAAAAACTELRQARPLAPLARAVVLARGGEPSAATDFRGALFAVVMPEVLDFDQFKSVHVTMRLLRKRDSVGAVRFRCRLLDASDKLVGEAEIGADRASVNQLMRVDATVSIPVDELDDGNYSVVIETLIDGAEPALHEPEFRVPVALSRGYGKRVFEHPLYLSPFHPDSAVHGERVAQTLTRIAKLANRPDARAAYADALVRVDRAFRGKPRLPGVDALADLARLDRMVAWLETEPSEAPYVGWTGRSTIAVPLGEPDLAPTPAALLSTPYARVSVELPTGHQAQNPRPLVLFVPGAPSWDGGSNRPMATESESPEWLIDRLRRAGFDRSGAFSLAVMESPGRVKSPVRAIAAIVRALRARGGISDVVLVGEREGAYCVSRALVADPTLARGAVLVTGGAFSNPELERIRECYLLLVPAHGHDSTRILASIAQRAEERSANGELRGPAAVLVPGEAHRPWPIALSLTAAQIEGFVRALSQ